MRNYKHLTVPTAAHELSATQFTQLIKIYGSSYDSKIDRVVAFVSVLLGQSTDYVEEMELDDLNAIVEIISVDSLFDVGDCAFVSEITVDGTTYRSSAKDNNYSFKVKELILLESKVKANENFLDDLAAIIFREVDADGNPSKDLSEEVIEARKQVFAGRVSITVMMPYLLKLNEKLSTKLELLK